jgi:hypothetical protein
MSEEWLQELAREVSYCFSLNQAHIMIPRVEQLILVQRVVLRFRIEELIQPNLTQDEKHSQAVPIIQTGPCDSDKMPLPENMVNCETPSSSSV